MIGQVWVNQEGFPRLAFVVVREKPSSVGLDVWDCLVLESESRPEAEGGLHPCSGSGIKKYMRLV